MQPQIPRPAGIMSVLIYPLIHHMAEGIHFSCLMNYILCIQLSTLLPTPPLVSPDLYITIITMV